MRHVFRHVPRITCGTCLVRLLRDMCESESAPCAGTGFYLWRSLFIPRVPVPVGGDEWGASERGERVIDRPLDMLNGVTLTDGGWRRDAVPLELDVT